MREFKLQPVKVTKELGLRHPLSCPAVSNFYKTKYQQHNERSYVLTTVKDVFKHNLIQVNT